MFEFRKEIMTSNSFRAQFMKQIDSYIVFLFTSRYDKLVIDPLTDYVNNVVYKSMIRKYDSMLTISSVTKTNLNDNYTELFFVKQTFNKARLYLESVNHDISLSTLIGNVLSIFNELYQKYKQGLGRKDEIKFDYNDFDNVIYMSFIIPFYDIIRDFDWNLVKTL